MKAVGRIALLYNHVLDVGGVEVHLLSLLRYVDPARYQYVIISPASASFTGKVGALGAHWVPWDPRGILDPRKPFQLARLLREEKISLVHGHSPTSTIPGALAARLAGLPFIETVHLPATVFYGRRTTARAQLGRKLYLRIGRRLNHCCTDGFIYVSEQVCANDITRGFVPPERTHVIRNGIDLKPFECAEAPEGFREQQNIPAGAVVIGFVGRMDDQKGIDVLLEAAARVMSPGDSFHLILIGDGPGRTDYEKLAEKLGLAGRVHFLGFRQDIPTLLRACDVFVLPSRYEGFPIALLEGMAARLPCVVTDVGENASIIEHDVTGFVIPPEAPDRLADALKALIDNPDLRRRMGEDAKCRAEAFSDVRMAAEVQAVYQAVLRKHDDGMDL